MNISYTQLYFASLLCIYLPHVCSSLMLADVKETAVECFCQADATRKQAIY